MHTHFTPIPSVPKLKSHTINKKIIVIMCLVFVCYIPTLFIQELIDDRQYYQTQANDRSIDIIRNNDSILQTTDQPLSDYRSITRATKYSVLFITLTFALFFLFEVLAKLKIHPINYGLVGLALGVFYLLLLSLSEVIGFTTAYIIASCATIGLIAIYMQQLLQCIKRTSLLTGVLGSLYTYLFVLLQLESYSLLFGSLLVFTTLAVLMLSTRHINWYEL